MDVGLEALGDWALPKRSVTSWEGPELDEVGGLVEKAFQSPNSPFPLDEGAAEQKTTDFFRFFQCLHYT